jgi:hypothetical protein
MLLETAGAARADGAGRWRNCALRRPHGSLSRDQPQPSGAGAEHVMCACLPRGRGPRGSGTPSTRTERARLKRFDGSQRHHAVSQRRGARP